MTSPRFLIVLLAILPLGVLASMNLLGALKKGDAAPEPVLAVKESHPAVTPAEREKLAVETAREAANIRPAVEQLEKFDLFGREVLEDAPTFPENSPFEQTVKSWGALKQAEKLTVEVGAVFRPVTKAGDELNAVESALKNPLLESVQGAGHVRDQLLERKRTLADRKATDLKVKEVHVAFKNGHFADSLRLIADIPVTELSADEARGLQEIERVSKFKEHWKNLPTSLETPRSRFKKLEELMNKSPDPVGKTEEDFIAEQKAHLTTAETAVMIDEFFAAPPQDLRDLVEGCENLVQRDPKTQQRLGLEIKKHLKSRLTAKKAMPLPDGIQEARKKDGGEYLYGVFKSLGGLKPAYRYYKTLADYKSSAGYTTLYLIDFDGPPGPARDVMAAKSYNEKRQDLTLHLDVKQKWTEFESSCTSWQKLVDEYYTVRTVTEPMKFQDEQQLAHDVLELWPRIKSFLSNS
jgi:hypothetical protein